MEIDFGVPSPRIGICDAIKLADKYTEGKGLFFLSASYVSLCNIEAVNKLRSFQKEEPIVDGPKWEICYANKEMDEDDISRVFVYVYEDCSIIMRNNEGWESLQGPCYQ